MKKIKSLISLSAFLGVMGLCSLATPVSLDGIDDGSMDTYIVTVDGEAGEASTNRKTNSVINQIGYLFDEEDYTIKYVYDTVYNGFAITTTSSVAEAIGHLSNVSSVNISQKYAAPETVESTDSVSSGTMSADNGYLEEKLGNYSRETIHATDDEIKAVTGGESVAAGAGIKIGILDTGLYMNQVEGTTARATVEQNYGSAVNAAAFKELGADVAMSTEETEAFQALFNSGLNATNPQYINNKVIYAWDYNDDNNDVVPLDDGGEHGTHVASLAAGNGDEFQGIAPNAQLAILKVFPDDASGATTEDIVAALEDAAKLGLDVVNLSLGSDLINDSESPSDAVYQALSKCEEAGIIVNYAAGNTGKSSFSSGNTYYDWTTDTAETSIIGSSSTLDEKVNVIASTNPDTTFYSEAMLVQKDGAISQTAVSYSDQVVSNANTQYDDEHPMLELLDGGQDSYEYIYINGYGEAQDYADASTTGDGKITGKIAVVDRGSTTFAAKVAAAEDAGAAALIVINNVDGNTFNFTFDFNDYEPSIPVCWVFKSTGETFGTHGDTGTIQLVQNTVAEASDGGSYSSFSSDGPGSNLDLFPTVAAPGNEVIGAISAIMTGSESELAGYDNLSGTSMATPNFTGAIASLLSEHLATDTEEEYEAYKSEVSMMAMSSADQVTDSSKATTASPRIQGAGQVNVANTLSSESYIYTTVTDEEFPDADGNASTRKAAKAELKNRGSLYTDLSEDKEAYIEFDYNVVNNSDEARTYTPSLSLLIPELNVATNGEDYDSDVENGSADEIPENQINAITVSVKDEELSLSDRQLSGNITVGAGETVSGSVEVRIDDIHIEKHWDDAQSQNGNGDFPEQKDFDGTLREYYDTYYNGEEGAGGGYVEGYLTLTETTDESNSLSMPYMGFYGDYTKGSAVEPFDFEKTEGHLYTSDMIDAYVKNLTSSYALENAYSSSTLTASGSALPAQTIGSIAGLDQSAQASTSGTFKTVEGGDDGKLYAGAEDVTDHLHAFFFVNRDIADSGWRLKNSNGTTVKEGDIYCYCATYSFAVNTGRLYKSWLHTGTTTYDLYRGYAGIDISDVDEGEYTLEFWFTIDGITASDAETSAGTQTNSYTLVVDRTAPEIQDVSISEVDGRKILTAITKGGNEATTVLQRGSATSVTALGDDLYQTEIDVSTYDYVTLQFADYAHNYTYATYHTDSLSVYFSTTEDGLVRTSNFDWAPIMTNTYEFTYLSGSSQNSTASPVDIQLHIYAGKGLDLVPEVYIDGNFADATYDSETGYVTITIPKGTEVCDIELNFDIQEKGVSSSEGGDTSSDTDTGEEEGSAGLSTGAVVGIAVGSVAGAGVIGGGIAFGVIHSKKKKSK